VDSENLLSISVKLMVFGIYTGGNCAHNNNDFHTSRGRDLILVNLTINLLLTSIISTAKRNAEVAASVWSTIIRIQLDGHSVSLQATVPSC
jgi:hypothetical protein